MKEASDDTSLGVPAREARPLFRFGAGFLAVMSLIAAIILVNAATDWAFGQIVLFISMPLFGAGLGYVAITGRYPPFGFGF